MLYTIVNQINAYVLFTRNKFMQCILVYLFITVYYRTLLSVLNLTRDKLISNDDLVMQAPPVSRVIFYHFLLRSLYILPFFYHHTMSSSPPPSNSNAKRVPTLNTAHYLYRMLTDLTFVHMWRNTCYLKRDDTFHLGIANGGKLRQCLKLVHDNLSLIRNHYNGGLITAAGLPSPQGYIVATVAKYFGLKCAVCTYRYKQGLRDYKRINTSLAQQLGARIYGVGNSNLSGGEKDARLLASPAQLGYYQVKFGMCGDRIVESVIPQVQNLPPTVRHVVVCGGSGLTAIGILRGLAVYQKKHVTHVTIVTLSNYTHKNLKRWYEPLPAKQRCDAWVSVKVVRSPIPYQRYWDPPELGGLFDLTYESKAMSWLLTHVKPTVSNAKELLFWCVGRKVYDLDYIVPIQWHTSDHERFLNSKREKRRLARLTTPKS